MSAIIQFLKLLNEHKEKIIFGVLVIAFIVVGAVLLREKEGGEGGKPPKAGGGRKTPPREAKAYPALLLGNSHPLELLLENAAPEIFVPSESGADGGDDEKKNVWAEIKVKSIFDATRSGSFIAIIEVDKKRMFVREGERFGELSVKRIDGIRKCLTIVRRGSQEEDEEKEFCTED